MSKMSTKGQVTIPKRLRDDLGLKPGVEVEFAVGNQGQLEIRVKRERQKPDFGALRGTLDLGMTTDEYMRFLRGDPDK